jgi:hypothetical protein
MGIAVAMALALTAFIGAGSASASQFFAPGTGQAEINTWSGSRSGGNHTLALSGDSISCSNVAFSGQMQGPLSREVTVTPELAGCKWQGLSNAFAMHGCKYRLRPGIGTEGSTGWIDIVSCESPMSIESGGCKIEIGNQNGIGTVQYSDVGEIPKKTLAIAAQLYNLEFTRKGTCTFGTGTFTGSYTGNWSAKATSPKGEQRELRIESSGPIKFSADEAPVKILGERQSGPIAAVFLAGYNGVLSCTVHALKGESATVTASTIAVTPAYSNCKFNGQSTTFSMGGCSYVYHAWAYEGVDIVGATCASNPITFTSAYEPCTITIGPQSGLSGLSFTNEGSGKTRSANTAGEAAGLVFTAGLGCSVPGTSNAGYYKSKDKFTATNSGGSQQGFSVE